MNYGNCWAKCLILRGSIKRIDLQTTYRYSAEPFRVYSYMVVLHSAAITMSDYMRVSHSGTSKLKIPEILKIFWPAWETCREATSEYSDSIFPVRILRIRTYQPCKYEGIGIYGVGTLICRSWGKYRRIMEIARQNVLFWRGSSNG